VKPGEAGKYVMQEGKLVKIRYLHHNPWAWRCSQRIEGEPYEPNVQCPLCDRQYVINEVGVL
jgi:hypothetical protein